MILHKEGRGCGFPSIYISPKKMSKRYFLDSVVLDAIKKDKTQLPKIIKEGFTPENGVDRDEAILLLSNVYQKTGDAFFKNKALEFAELYATKEPNSKDRSLMELRVYSADENSYSLIKDTDFNVKLLDIIHKHPENFDVLLCYGSILEANDTKEVKDIVAKIFISIQMQKLMQKPL